MLLKSINRRETFCRGALWFQQRSIFSLLSTSVVFLARSDGPRYAVFLSSILIGLCWWKKKKKSTRNTQYKIIFVSDVVEIENYTNNLGIIGSSPLGWRVMDRFSPSIIYWFPAVQEPNTWFLCMFLWLPLPRTEHSRMPAGNNTGQVCGEYLWGQYYMFTCNS